MTRIFVDTNILAYARDTRDPVKQQIAERWLVALAHNRQGRLSWQVLAEFYAVATHPRKLAAPIDRVRADIVALQVWQPLMPDAVLFETAWRLADRYDFCWWDALIVAAARRSDCGLLLSEDLHDGLVIDGVLRILDPFASGADQPPADESR